MDRREFVTGVVAALFAQKVAAESLLERRASSGVREWVAAHQDIANQLAKGRITARQWQAEVEALASRVDMRELLEQIDFAAIERSIDLSQPGGTKKLVRLESGLAFATAVFGLQRGHAITPHAHRHMVSAHMVLEGELHVRNFDRLSDEPGHIVVEPTVDATIRRGAVSTMSTERNNVHWFTALSPTAFTFDVILDGLTPNEKPYVIELLDVAGAQRLPGGRRRARIIDWKESVRLYGIES